MNLRLFAARIYHDYFTNQKRFKKWGYYDKTQWFSSREIKSIQNEKLKKILDYCVENVPVFNGLSGQLTGMSEEDLRLFPVTDKEFYRTNAEKVLSTKKNSIKYYESSTSGSTGKSFFFKLDANRLSLANAVKYRTDSFAGVLPSDSRASLWGASFDNDKNKGLISRFRNFLTPFTFLSSYEISDDSLKEYVKILNKKKPKLLVSYSSPLMLFAKYCEKNKISLPYLKAIISSSEQLFDFQKTYIESVLKVKVYNRYGTREFGSIAQECKVQEGLHVNEERVYIEILDDNNQPCKVGEKGQLVITDLDNIIMPLIRYKVGDFAAWEEDLKCNCKRGLRKLKFIEGRSFDIVQTPNGQKISGTFWTLLLRHVSKDIIEFQIVQDEINGITIKIVHPYGKLKEEELKKLYSKIKEKDKSLSVNLEYVNKIDLTKSGKRKFIVSNI